MNNDRNPYCFVNEHVLTKVEAIYIVAHGEESVFDTNVLTWSNAFSRCKQLKMVWFDIGPAPEDKLKNLAYDASTLNEIVKFAD